MPRRQFSLKTLLWLVACAALASLWLGAALRKGGTTSSLFWGEALLMFFMYAYVCGIRPQGANGFATFQRLCLMLLAEAHILVGSRSK